LIGIALILLTLGAYYRVCTYDFISYDDLEYVKNNYQVLEGITLEGFRYAFTTNDKANWHPLTWLSLMLDCELGGDQNQLFGSNPRLGKIALEKVAHTCHTTSLLFHLINTVLLFLLLTRMTAALWRSALVAALFALHPLHVESVAWISERKDVLSTFFWFITMWAYVRYAAQPSVKRYIPVVLFFILGFMAKPMLVTLPFVLLLMDYWPLKRWPPSPLAVNQKETGPEKTKKGRKKTTSDVPYFQKSTWRALIIEKLPLFGLTTLFCVITFFVQRGAGAVQPIEFLGLKVRLANAVVAYAVYIGKMFYPLRLGLFYPHLGMPPPWQITGAALILILFSALALWQRKRPALLAGWLWYLGTLVPVIGLIQVGDQALADRYTYIPLTGLFIALVWTLAELFAPWRRRQIVSALLAAAIMAALTVCTWRQVGYWSDSITLFEHALKVIDKNHLAHNHLGLALYYRGEPGDLDKAIDHHRRAIQLRDDYFHAYVNLGMELMANKDYEEAKVNYYKALEIHPRSPSVLNHLGALLRDMHGGASIEGEQYLREALERIPDYFNARMNLAESLYARGEYEQALEQLQEALRLNPNHPRTRQLWQMARAKLDQTKQPPPLGPEDPTGLFNKALTLARQERYQEAVELFKKVLQLKPDWPRAHQALGDVYLYLNQPQPAIEHLSEAVKLNPDYPAALNNLAWVLATVDDDKLRRPSEAVKHAQKANNLTNYSQPEMLDVLAAACAADGKFNLAVTTAQKALQLARAAGKNDLVSKIENRLKLYQAGQPYREKSKSPDKRETENAAASTKNI